MTGFLLTLAMFLFAFAAFAGAESVRKERDR